MTRHPLPRMVWRKSGWGYKTKTKYRQYVTVFSGLDQPVTTFLSAKAALEFIRKQEKEPLLCQMK